MLTQIKEIYNGFKHTYYIDLDKSGSLDLPKIYEHPLTWLTTKDGTNCIGHLPSNGYEYGEGYWEIYQKYASNDVGVKLTQARSDFVSSHGISFDDVVDVGVGSGQFVDTVKCKGTDVNPIANQWLKDNGYYVASVESFSTLTLWDVLEHIEDPRELLKNATNVFISTPIYKNLDEVLKSKHLKPGEHIWYFTDIGINTFMKVLGFNLISESSCESDLGRDSISSYYFQRR